MQLEYELAAPVQSTQFRNIDVSSDVTWMTRGHSSKVGAASVIGCEMGKFWGWVLDQRSANPASIGTRLTKIV